MCQADLFTAIIPVPARKVFTNHSAAIEMNLFKDKPHIITDVIFRHQWGTNPEMTLHT